MGVFEFFRDICTSYLLVSYLTWTQDTHLYAFANTLRKNFTTYVVDNLPKLSCTITFLFSQRASCRSDVILLYCHLPLFLFLLLPNPKKI